MTAPALGPAPPDGPIPHGDVGDSSAMAAAVEALLFVADEPLRARVIAQVLGADPGRVEEVLIRLSRSLEERGSGIVLRQVAGGWRLATSPSVAEPVERFLRSSRQRLTRAAIETLAIVAYKQPVTRHQVAAIRGVSSDGVLRSLSERGLIAEVGREEAPGRPVLFGTTPQFLERLGLSSIADLPPLGPMLADVAREETA